MSWHLVLTASGSMQGSMVVGVSVVSSCVVVVSGGRVVVTVVDGTVVDGTVVETVVDGTVTGFVVGIKDGCQNS